MNWLPGSGPTLPIEERFERLEELERRVADSGLSEADQAVTFSRLSWIYVIAREQQLEPEDVKFAGLNWFLLGGRGSGKTRTGSETLSGWALQIPDSWWACIAPTFADVLDTMFTGESGLRSVLPTTALWGGSWEKAFNSTKLILRLANGARIRGFSSEKPGRIRGPQFQGFWADEVAEFRDSHQVPDHPGSTWSNITFATRLPGPDGWHPRGIITGTPAPVALLAGNGVEPGLLTGHPDMFIEKMSTRDNLDNLASKYRRMVDRLSGTRTGRQEIDAELLTDVEGALWLQSWIVLGDRPELADFVHIAVGVDPSGGRDEVGVVVVGITEAGVLWVLEDVSGRYTPRQWATAAWEAYQRWQADSIVAERNYGGDMVQDTITRHTDAPGTVVKMVTASRGKRVRAEPISLIFEPSDGHPAGERARFAQPMPELAAQMTSWVPDKGLPSPDRMDAMVWAAIEVTGYELGGSWDSSSLARDLGTRSD